MKTMLLVVLFLLSLANFSFADDSRFVFTDKTVLDKKTGLMWTRDGNLGKRNFDNAPELLNELNTKKYAGYNDWRLPSVAELTSLKDYAKGVGYDGASASNRPFILFNKMGFYDVQEFYWSSESNSRLSSTAWMLEMDIGTIIWEPKHGVNSILPVRKRIKE